MFTANGYYYDPEHEIDMETTISGSEHGVEVPLEVTVTGSSSHTASMSLPSAPIHLAPPYHAPTQPRSPRLVSEYFATPPPSRIPRPRQMYPAVASRSEQPSPHRAPISPRTQTEFVLPRSGPTRPSLIHLASRASGRVQPLATHYSLPPSERRRQLSRALIPIGPQPSDSVSMQELLPPETVVTIPSCSIERSSMPDDSSIPAAGQYPKGDFRNSSRETVRDIQSAIMVKWLHSTQLEKLWSRRQPGEGVILKKGRDSFTCCPESLKTDSSEFYNQVVAMNVRV